MRRRITLLVAGTTSMIVLAFVIPLTPMLMTYAQQSALIKVGEATRNLAVVVANVKESSALAKVVDGYQAKGGTVAIYTPDGQVYGALPQGVTLKNLTDARTETEATIIRNDVTYAVVSPVRTGDGSISVLVSYIPTSDLYKNVPGALLVLYATGAVLLAFSVLLADQIGRRVARPVIDLAKVANSLRSGDLSARAAPEPPPQGTPETYQLGTAFNLLADRIGELVAQERESVADLGHRLRTPVTALRLDTDLVADPEVAERIRSHVDHLHRSIDAVVREARRHTRDTIVRETCDAAALVSDRASFWRPLAEDQGRTLTVFGTATPLAVPLPSEDLREILDTLIDNVFAHTPEGAPIELRLTSSQSAVAVTVADGGPGADPSSLRRGESTAGSTGLGLDIVRRLAESSGGQVSMRQSNLGGLAVDVVLPLAA